MPYCKDNKTNHGKQQEKCTAFKNGLLFHKVFGLWPIDEGFYSVSQMFRGFAMAIISILIPFYQLTALRGDMNKEKLPEFIVDCLVSVIAIFKVVPFITCREIIQKLMNITEEINLTINKNEKRKNIADYWMKIQSYLAKAMAISYHTMFSTFFLLPLLGDKGFPLQGAFPRYFYETPWFQITYGVITILQFFRLYGVLSGNILCNIFMCQLFSELQIVQNLIEDLKDNDRKYYFYVLKRHEKVLSYGSIICSYFSPVFLLLILTYAIIICFCGVTAIKTDSMALFFKMIGFAMICASEVFMLCFVGETATTESLKIADKISSTAVSVFLDDISSLKCTSFSLQRAQRSLRLVVGNEGVLNLSYFSVITSKIVSFFTVFKTLLDEGRI